MRQRSGRLGRGLKDWVGQNGLKKGRIKAMIIIDKDNVLKSDDSEIGKVSDGYHTFDELYDHRCLLFIALCVQLKHSFEVGWKCDYPGWFLLFAELPTGQISYHIPEKYLDYVAKNGINECNDYQWDGHTSNDVINRLIGFIKVTED
jgi:hypothetical protein